MGARDGSGPARLTAQRGALHKNNPGQKPLECILPSMCSTEWSGAPGRAQQQAFVGAAPGFYSSIEQWGATHSPTTGAESPPSSESAMVFRAYTTGIPRINCQGFLRGWGISGILGGCPPPPPVPP